MNQMRTSQKNRNSRHKSRGNKPSGNVLNRVYESAGPEGKVRGTAQQIIDKYLLLARDAQTSGDRVVAENFLQHAEHYIRLVNSAMPPQAEDRRFQGYGAPRDDSDEAGDDGDDQPTQSNGRDDHGAQPRMADASGNATADDPRDSHEARPSERRRNAPVSGSGLETIDAAGDDSDGPVPTPETRSTDAAPAGEDPNEGADEKPQADVEAQAETASEPEEKPKPRRRTRRPKVSDPVEAG